jgi:heme A synthase
VTQSLSGSVSALAGWSVEGSLPILAVVVAAGLGTSLLFAVSLAAYRRRRQAQYRLISLAVGALLARSVVGVGTVLGAVPMPVHHLLAHSLDFLIAATVLYAVYAHAPGAVGDDAASD